MIYKLKPFLKDYIWGGNKLKERYGKKSDLKRIAESWELSVLKGSESKIDGGEDDGRTLLELSVKYPGIFGENVKKFKDFPVLIKLIDADKDLSVQVHPDDEYAYSREHSRGKTEMWYVAEAREGAAIFYGFYEDTSAAEIRELINKGELPSLLNRVPVCKGEAFFVPAGRVHAILAGATIVEIQENSDLTYRLYDYGRLDDKGRPRELHLEKALEVIDFKKTEAAPVLTGYKRSGGARQRLLAECEYFKAVEAVLKGNMRIGEKNSFAAVTIADGEGEFTGEIPAKKGDTFFIPAGCKAALSGSLTAIITTI
jgi:Phosphomannose isomerase